MGDADTGPNNLQNFPMLSSAEAGRRATIKGRLERAQNGAFIIQFFSDPKSIKEEGKKLIGVQGVIHTNGDSIISFAFDPTKKVKEELFVTATAKKAVTGDTSEFSAPKKVRG